ncbi:MAG: hypothetical protein ACKPHU_02655, partial [Planctomycetaceae bacterium]
HARLRSRDGNRGGVGSELGGIDAGHPGTTVPGWPGAPGVTGFLSVVSGKSVLRVVAFVLQKLFGGSKTASVGCGEGRCPVG